MGHRDTPNRYVQLHRDLRQASIRVPYASTLIDACAHVRQSVSDLWAVASWVLTTSSSIKVCESRSIRPKAALPRTSLGKRDVGYFVGCSVRRIQWDLVDTTIGTFR